jgi:hypothetical protein
MKRATGYQLFLLVLLGIGLAGCSGNNFFPLLTSVRFSTFGDIFSQLYFCVP